MKRLAPVPPQDRGNTEGLPYSSGMIEGKSRHAFERAVW
jgi:hypothetical protein